MTTLETATALINWTVATIGTLSVPNMPTLAQVRAAPEADWPLPDVACAVTEAVQRPGTRNQRTQQGIERARTCVLMLACHPEPADSAGEWVYKACDLLMDGLATDKTLGSRVASADPVATASFEPAFVEFEEGGTARQATLTLVVRDRVNA